MLSGHLRETIMRVYDTRPTTAESIMDIAEMVDSVAKREYSRGRKDQWIPCSDRLPEKDGEYLVTAWNDMLDKPFVLILYYGTPISEKRRDWYMFDRDGDFYYDSVIAWQPLPEPYRMEE